jgi:hypothetical protein
MAVHAVAAECRDQRRVDVDRLAVELAAQLEDRQEPQQRDEADVVLGEFGVQRVVERGDRRERAARVPSPESSTAIRSGRFTRRRSRGRGARRASD